MLEKVMELHFLLYAMMILAVVGIIGCMAERLKEKLVEGPYGVDVVAGPDAYRDLPRLVREAEAGGKGVNVLLSTEETYAEIAPVRLDRNGVSALSLIHISEPTRPY